MLHLEQAFACTVRRISLLQGAGEADSSGNPFGFMDEKLPGANVNFPALFTTQMSASRSVDVLQYLMVSNDVALHSQ